jgi:RNA polymerase sigma-70 factor, ECF subfamily
MLGSSHDAEDALQDTLLRAWRALPRFIGRCQLRTWLYRIATNVCLDAIAGRRKQIPPLEYGPAPGAGDNRAGEPVSHAPPIEPYLDGAVDTANGALSPEVRYERREALELAFVAALSHLPTRQRSALILRDVLGFSAKEAAHALATTVASVNGAVLRARRAIDEGLPDESGYVAAPAGGDRPLRDTAVRFADALERGEIDALLALLAEDRPFTISLRPAASDRDVPRGPSRHRRAQRARRDGRQLTPRLALTTCQP